MIDENNDSAVVLKRLDLSNFRNYSALHLDVKPSPIVLTGPNGAGKTNLLEAISMLMPGRGMRSAPFDVLLAKNSPVPQWAVSALVEGPDDQVRLGTSWQTVENGQGLTSTPTNKLTNARPSSARLASLDGDSSVGIGAFADYIRIIWLTPAMDRLFSGPSGDRRRFLDRLVSVTDLAHSRASSNFEKLMRQRNALLAEQAYDKVWLSTIEQQMAQQAVAIAAARLASIDALQGHIDAADGRDTSLDLRQNISNIFPAARLVLQGSVEALVRDNPAVQCEDEYAKILADSRGLDQAAGRTLNGPHRSDLMVFHAQKDMEARACSTGEQKALLVGLILAQARMVKSQFQGRMPVLLLDEVAAHLDKDRRQGLFDELLATGAQCWLTGTDTMQFEALENNTQFFTVNNGQVE